VRRLDYNNMNRRASRSAYNYDDDRRSSKQNPKVKRENNADFSDFKKKRPATQNNPQKKSSQNRNIQNPPTARPETRQNTQKTRPSAPQRPQNHQRPQRPDGAVNTNAKRPHNPKNRAAQNPRASQMKKSTAKKAAPKNQQRRNDWVYPEGFNAQGAPRQRRPQDPRRRPQNQPGKRPQQKKKSAPAIRIHIDWQRVGAVCAAVAIRFLCCILLVAAVLSVYFFKNFYTRPQPPAEDITYVFKTVTGEGDDAVTSLNEIVSVGSLAYDGNELLISFSEVSKWLGTAQVGDIYSMRFVLGDDNISQTVVFHNSSQDAFVNGTPVIMKSRAQFRHGEVWVPVSFIKDYITGVEITEAKNTVSLSKNGEELSFTLSSVDALTPVPAIEDEE